MITVDSPVTTVLGDRQGKRRRIVEGLGIRTVGDLLRHLPRRYLRTGELTRVEDLRPGQLLTVVGEVVASDSRTYTDRRTGRLAHRLEVVLQTDGPSLRMTFFSQKAGTAKWQASRLRLGRRGVFLGQVSRFRGEWQLTNPTMSLFGVDEEADVLAAETFSGLFPLYPLTRGIEHADLQRAVTFARTVLDDVPDLVPEQVRRDYGLLDARTAFDHIHAPDDLDDVERAQRRLRFEEALVTQLVLARRRRRNRDRGGSPLGGGEGRLLAAFDARLPFELTAGQRAVGAEIAADLAQPWPMHRLLQGEVGSGKTVVALRAMLRAVDSGAQAALLAPTEVLAQQHHRSITALLGDLAAGGMLGGAEEGTRVELLTGSMPRARRAETLLRLASGETGVAVGTHALLEDEVVFAGLGLVVVDEQHRFGVEQRAALTEKSWTPPHVLVMTATPIPRTVAMTVFGDLEASTLTEVPAGRAPVQTTVVDVERTPGWLARVWDRVREEVASGRQAYVVCPRITGDELEQGESDPTGGDPDESDDPGGTLDEVPGRPVLGTLAAVDEVSDSLHAGPLQGLRLARLHGRLPAEEKERVMRAFAAGDIDVLVATTVIEVGVDVPNASTMVVLDADRFGVSQLHQLRGRIGRGSAPGVCLLVAALRVDSPARERLHAVAATTDGFELSRVDLEQRREGDVLGRSQWGRSSSLRHLRVLRDEQTILEARAAAEALLDQDPELTEHLGLARAVAGMEESRQSEFMEKS